MMEKQKLVKIFGLIILLAIALPQALAVMNDSKVFMVKISESGGELINQGFYVTEAKFFPQKNEPEFGYLAKLVSGSIVLHETRFTTVDLVLGVHEVDEDGRLVGNASTPQLVSAPALIMMPYYSEATSVEIWNLYNEKVMDIDVRPFTEAIKNRAATKTLEPEKGSPAIYLIWGSVLAATLMLISFLILRRKT